MTKATNNSIFSYINPSSNEFFSKLSLKDQDDLIKLINSYYLELRDNLNLDWNTTFGLEIEHEYANRVMIQRKLIQDGLLDSWGIGNDSSLTFGGEIRSPILTDKKELWKELKQVCKILNRYSKISYNSSGHIHVGTQTLGFEYKSWLNFLKLWSVYENIIFRFSYGEFLNGRPYINKYAEEMSKEFMDVYKNLDRKDLSYLKIINEFTYNRDCAVNFCNIEDIKNFMIGNTIEFRCPNGTFDPVIWQNNVNLFTKILLYSKSKNFDNNTINQRYCLNMKDKITNYDKICLNQALEFIDLVFNSNIDKVYFLRQYLKSFESSEVVLKKAKKFTKK